MSGVKETVLSVCSLWIVIELLVGICPKDDLVRLLRSVICLLLIFSLCLSLFSADWSFSFSFEAAESRQEELTEYVKDRAQEAVQQEEAAYLEGLLAAAGLRAKKIQVFTDIQEDSGIVLTKVSVLFEYGSQVQRGRELLKGVLGEETEVEVTGDGR